MKIKHEDLTRKVFENWTVIKRVEDKVYTYPYEKRDIIRAKKRYLCRCECGNEKIVFATSLLDGISKHCGCRGIERAPEFSTINVFSIWRNMISRCTNEKSTSYKHYGKHGIKVDERWMDFNNFCEDMGKKPTGFTFHRIDKSLNYTKDNCEWVEKEKGGLKDMEKQKKKEIHKDKEVNSWLQLKEKEE